MNIISGKQNRALKVVIYGSEGIGKTTLASKFPDPLFIDTEGGTAYMDVRRTIPASWEELLTAIREVTSDQSVCKTLVVDTADWAETLCLKHVLKDNGKTSIEAFGFGKGYVILAEEFKKLLDALDGVIKTGRTVVITAHAKMRKFEQPDEEGAYDRWEMKLTRQCAPLLKEWCDMLLFLNYKTYVVTTDNDKKKAQGGKRVIYTTHHACWDAKNRQNLPEEMDLDFNNIAFLFEGEPAKAEQKPIEALRGLMEKDGVTDADIQKIVSDKGHYPPETPIDQYEDRFISGWLIKHWNKIITTIKQNTED